jgi:ABC-type enterochelin transport system substrate-binding protein
MAIALCVLVLTGACSNDQSKSNVADSKTNAATPAVAAQQADLTPEQLGELGAQIQKNPKDAQRLLTEHKLNEQTFEQAIRKVSEDPAAAKRYSASYKKASA